MRFFAITLLLASFALAPRAKARQIENWPYERLFKEADLVVIASAKGTVDTDDHAPDGRWAASLVGQKTTFAVHSALKGHAGDGPLAVTHFRLKDKGRGISNGPLLVAFRTDGIILEGGRANKYSVALPAPQYLLFLKATAGGRFEPLSGQIDPELSVKEIYPPLPDVIDGR